MQRKGGRFQGVALVKGGALKKHNDVITKKDKEDENVNGN